MAEPCAVWGSPTWGWEVGDEMNVLLTGCAGFIGGKVTEFLLKDGHTVVGVDSLNDAYDPRLKEWRLAQLRKRSGFEFHHLDISKRDGLHALFQQGSFDALINLAARAGVRSSVEDPWAYYETNVIGTLNLLELCRRYGVKKFILASTSSVYGSPNTLSSLTPHTSPPASRPFREDQPTDCPLSPYAASKKAAETLCYTYHYLYGFDIIVLRYFTVYGPAGRPDMSVFRFIKWIAEGEPVIVYGDGTQKRDFTYVDDVAKGTVAALKPLGFEIINLGGDRPVPIQGVIQLLEDLLGRKAQINQQPRHPADVPATWADTAKARRLLGWKPEVALEEGLKRTAEWYLQNRQFARGVSLE